LQLLLLSPSKSPHCHPHFDFISKLFARIRFCPVPTLFRPKREEGEEDADEAVSPTFLFPDLPFILYRLFSSFPSLLLFSPLHFKVPFFLFELKMGVMRKKMVDVYS
jgi:hypothetical protein